jgi:hypothetical protein
MKLVLSGSHITAMKQLEDADQPLYGRRTARIDIDALRLRPRRRTRARLARRRQAARGVHDRNNFSLTTYCRSAPDRFTLPSRQPR